MNQVYSREFSIPVWFVLSVNFLFMTSRATGTGILVKRALTSKYTKVSSVATFCFLGDSANSLLSLTNEILLQQYH